MNKKEFNKVSENLEFQRKVSRRNTVDVESRYITKNKLQKKDSDEVNMNNISKPKEIEEEVESFVKRYIKGIPEKKINHETKNENNIMDNLQDIKINNSLYNINDNNPGNNNNFPCNNIKNHNNIAYNSISTLNNYDTYNISNANSLKKGNFDRNKILEKKSNIANNKLIVNEVKRGNIMSFSSQILPKIDLDFDENLELNQSSDLDSIAQESKKDNKILNKSVRIINVKAQIVDKEKEQNNSIFNHLQNNNNDSNSNEEKKMFESGKTKDSFSSNANDQKFHDKIAELNKEHSRKFQIVEKKVVDLENSNRETIELLLNQIKNFIPINVSNILSKKLLSDKNLISLNCFKSKSIPKIINNGLKSNCSINIDPINLKQFESEQEKKEFTPIKKNLPLSMTSAAGFNKNIKKIK